MIIKAPNPIEFDDPDHPHIFLAGSIEMDKAEKWQDRVAEALTDNYVVLNPRRDDWDSSWTQSKGDANFRQQVEWELSAQEHVDYILMYFDPATMSPISLLELGLFGPTGRMTVVCPDGFWRKGNVDIVCEMYGIRQLPTLDDAITYFKELNP